MSAEHRKRELCRHQFRSQAHHPDQARRLQLNPARHWLWSRSLKQQLILLVNRVHRPFRKYHRELHRSLNQVRLL